MVSDVLCDAVNEIRNYLVQERYSPAEEAMIKALVSHMDAVRMYLDTPPFVDGTKLEYFHRNETRK